MNKEREDIWTGEGRKPVKVIVDMNYQVLCKGCGAMCSWAKVMKSGKSMLVERKKIDGVWRVVAHFGSCENVGLFKKK